MAMKAVIVLGFVSALIAGCSTTAPDEDDIGTKDNRKEAGLFTGESGDFSLTEYFSEEKKAERRKKQNALYGTGYNVDIPAIDEQSFEDFENFKAWRRSQEPGSANYQEYQDWRAYQQYLRFKAKKAEEAQQ